MMFDIPVELFIFGITLSLIFAGFGLVRNKDGYRRHWMIITSGMFIAIFALSTQNIIMGYSDGSSGLVLANTTTSQSFNITETVVETEVFTDAYTTNTGWTQVGTLVTVDSGVTDKVAYAWTSNNNQRVHKDIGTTITPSETFRIDWEFTYSAFNAGGNTAPEPIAVLTVGTGDPTTSTADMLGIGFRTSTNTGMNIIYKDDGGSMTSCQIPNTLGTSVQYYVTLERITPNTVILYVYTDSDRTVLLTGYPHSCSIPATVGGFTHLQHGHNPALITSITANGDNMLITVGETETVIEATDSGITEYNYQDVGGSQGGANLFNFTTEVKVPFVLIGGFVCICSVFLMRSED